LLTGGGMDGYWCARVIFLLIRHHDQTITMASDGNHTSGFGIEVPLISKSQDMLDDCEIDST